MEARTDERLLGGDSAIRALGGAGSDHRQAMNGEYSSSADVAPPPRSVDDALNERPYPQFREVGPPGARVKDLGGEGCRRTGLDPTGTSRPVPPRPPRVRSGSVSSISSHPGSESSEDEVDELETARIRDSDAPGTGSSPSALLNCRAGAEATERGPATSLLLSTRSHESSSRRKPHHPAHTFRRVQRVSRHAALATKQQLWDSNAVSIDAALSAVNQWESAYLALRGLVMGGAQNVGNLYGAAKSQASNLEHGILKPIRDWVLLPALVGMERGVAETVNLVQQHHGSVFEGTQSLARSVPVVGDKILAPSLFWSVELAKRTWDVIQYPIPSKQQVTRTVDTALTGTKWALSAAARECLLYMKRADAILTRTLSATQWKVLGKGPYATLDDTTKAEVIDHVCERYLSMGHDCLGRYELVAHIRLHNPPLYQDLVLTGVLQERGGALTVDDEWLSTRPVYRNLATTFLLETASSNPSDDQCNDDQRVSPLWFRLPNVNGKRPPKDAPWIPIRRSDAARLEERFLHLVNGTWNGDSSIGPQNVGSIDGQGCPGNLKETAGNPLEQNRRCVPERVEEARPTSSFRSPYPTVAQWYDPDVANDVLVDQRRGAVSFHFVCSKCRAPVESELRTIPQDTAKSDKLCKACASSFSSSIASAVSSFASLGPPPLSMVLRPTYWRFHGDGDDVRRATWLLDTTRFGLQPFDDEASGILEDAYLFLNWMSLRRAFQVDECDSQAAGAILTVEVPCPDGQDRLVQFTSLTRATAIQKGLGSAIALFKQRVYRGACRSAKPYNQQVRDEMAPLEKSFRQAVENHGTLGTTPVPDTSIRAALTPESMEPDMLRQQKRAERRNKPVASLAVQPEELDEKMGDSLDDEEDRKVDHLVLVVHGIGEMLRTIDLFGLSIPNLSSIVDCCAFLRKNHAEVQDAHFSQMYPSEIASADRVEYLPVEWHEAFTILSQRRADPANDTSVTRLPFVEQSGGRGARNARDQRSHDVMMKDISLRTIPNMREFANDTLLDVLYFMSPEHHDVITEIVTSEMNAVVKRFRSLLKFSGRVSIVGHSLGSIIVWDILSNQSDAGKTTRIPNVLSQESIDASTGFLSPSTEMSYLYGYAPELTARKRHRMNSTSQAVQTSDYPLLEFDVDNFFMLGSPVSVFLMIRNQRRPLSEDFALHGCDRVFNIFHPYDPVAYRLEPCIDPRNANFDPTIMAHWNGGFRVHYQTKRLWRKFVDTTWKTQQNVVEAFEARMAAMGLIDSAVSSHFDDDVSSSDQSADSRNHHVITGALNQGRRIDYMLQEKEIENANEYVAALAAHSSYWMEKDLSLFISRQICLSKHVAELEGSRSWDHSESDSSVCA